VLRKSTVAQPFRAARGRWRPEGLRYERPPAISIVLSEQDGGTLACRPRHFFAEMPRSWEAGYRCWTGNRRTTQQIHTAQFLL